MNITRGTKVEVTLPYAYINGQVGEVTHPAEGVNGLHVVKMADGGSYSLYDSEFKIYTPPLDPKVVLREKIETKIEEFREKLPANGRLVHEHQQDAYSIIVGLQIALDILNEEE